MHFTTTVEALNSAWTYLQKIPVRPFSSEGTLVRAEGETLTVTMSDTDMTMRIQIPGVTITEEGVLSFSLKSVMSSIKVCKESSSPVEFWTTPVEDDPTRQMLHVRVEGYAVDDMPGQTESFTRAMDEMDEATLHSVVLSQNHLKQGLENTIFAAVPSSSRAMRAIFQSVLVELAPNEIRFIATDTNNFAYFKRTNIENTETAAICLPIKATEILNSILRDSNEKSGEVRFSYGERFFSVETEDFTFMARLREGKFPDYSIAIPQGDLNEVVVARSDIKNAIDFFIPFDSQKALPVELRIKGDKMMLTLTKTKSVALVNKEIRCVFPGNEEHRIAFQMSALKNAFDHFSSQDVYIFFPDSSDASALLRPASEIDENVEFWQLITTTDLSLDE